MINLGKPEDEIKAFCLDRDEGFNYKLFIEKAIEYRDREILDKNGNIKKEKGSFYGITTDENIGNMAANVRARYWGTIQGKIPEHIKQILEDIGFPWSAKDEIKKHFDSQWLKTYCKLKDFLNNNNGCFPRNSASRLDEERSLAVWCVNQRKRLDFKNESDDRVKLLNDISFVWISEYDWFEEFLIGLDNYKSEHGNYVGVTHDKVIGAQVSAIRQAYKGKDSIDLKPYMITELELRLFPWDAHEELWLQQYENLKMFIKEKQRWPVSTKYKNPTEEQKYEKSLATWCEHQRKNFNDETLKEHRQTLLEEIDLEK